MCLTTASDFIHILYIKPMTPFKKLFFGGIVALILGICAYAVLQHASVVHADTSTDSTDATSTSVDQDIVDLLNSFQTVSIDPSLFATPLFQSLRDFGSVIPTEVPGRANPFAPIGSDTMATPLSGTSKTKTQ